MNHFDMELTQRQVKKHKKATKKEKGEIITRYCELTGVSRNLASKRFRRVIRDIHPRVLPACALHADRKDGKPQRKRGRNSTYTSIHKAIVRRIWELSDEICGERLHPMVGDYIKQLEENGELKYYGKRYIAETRWISEPTLKRIIARFPKANGRKKHKGNESIYREIPINAHFGKNTDKPGYVEIDYVEHNGGNSSGTYAHTGCYVDVCLGWIGRSAALGKNMQGVKNIHTFNEDRIYHRVHEYHPDNAKPILKVLLEKVTGEKPAGYTISRSRPYHKEDNGHVEQKNGDKVRKLVGYHRYDTAEQVELLNKLYRVEDLISNFFLPSQKLVEKVKDEKGRVIRRKHDRAKNAYQRLLQTKGVAVKVKKQVMRIYNGLNLVELRGASEKLKYQLFQTVIG